MNNNTWQENTGVQPVDAWELVDALFADGSQWSEVRADDLYWSLKDVCPVVKWRLHESKE